MFKKLKELFDLEDILVFSGLFLIGIGAYIIYPPAGFIVTGIGLFGIGMNWFSKIPSEKDK